MASRIHIKVAENPIAITQVDLCETIPEKMPLLAKLKNLRNRLKKVLTNEQKCIIDLKTKMANIQFHR